MPRQQIRPKKKSRHALSCSKAVQAGPWKLSDDRTRGTAGAVRHDGPSGQVSITNGFDDDMQDSAPRELPDSLREELEAIYREVDDQISSTGVVCWTRGLCCDFDRAEHVLYASTVEVSYLAEKYGTDLPRPEGRLCPFWREGLCCERERRPLGCRTYFCDATYRDATEALYERSYARIRAAAVRHGVEWEYAPFVDQLHRRSAAADTRPRSDLPERVDTERRAQ